MFAGMFNDFTPEQCVALLSCFVFDEKSEGAVKLRPELAGPYRQLQEMARKIAKISLESKIAVDVERYVQKFSPHMMEVCFAWCNGAKFSDVCHMTDVFEGSIIRCMRRLAELLRQMCSAATAIGNSDLENKFTVACNKMKRDIAFAASLYL